ncbi:type III effector [Enterobacter sp. Cy-643]|uniref:type III effector n=1 Tax=Enterobacter sp. Cy-643 TaxID=2608346 RepID=UPI00141DC21E|nr:type III effector [Enterobacter sp. Cy-643]NIF33071.1 type III effector [Enterobacter sp. Cy-643]
MRPNLNLKIQLPTQPSVSGSTQRTQLDARAHLEGSFDQIKAEMQRCIPTRFSPLHSAPTYLTAQSSMQSSAPGWRISHSLSDVFMHVTRNESQNSDNRFVGDKLHISVHPGQVGKAFDTLAPLLMSKESPTEQWKVTNMAHPNVISAPDNRTVKNAQFTLYLKPDKPDGTYSSAYLQKVKDLIETAESGLSYNGISHSQDKPSSDAAANNWGFTSWRNEYQSSRNGDIQQQNQQKHEPFFKLISS